ncbi:MAG: tRNA (adenosine(37)-N6)-threonylcarbamoyltransferase complex dimerization subunit type 1 TsaB [Deltaproteobacteria bacterium]|nr:tRNA (adenosine(37)-N6)-threonylcarbamoyltransferase complex dimerization subunit type 1 TsaB [Deltaproteobacteria bacterium]
MKILAFDTSTKVCSVALLENREIICEIATMAKAGHSASLLPIIAKALHITKWAREEIDLIVVGCGPGSFTGIRIGIATAKGLAMAINCKTLGICTLDALAYGMAPSKIPIMPAIDARKSEIFCALYSPDGEIYSQYLNIKPEDISEIIDQDTLFIGDALETYSDILKKTLKTHFHVGPRSLWYPKASLMGLMAMDISPVESPYDIRPVYVRPSDATLALQEKDR